MQIYFITVVTYVCQNNVHLVNTFIVTYLLKKMILAGTFGFFLSQYSRTLFPSRAAPSLMHDVLHGSSELSSRKKNNAIFFPPTGYLLSQHCHFQDRLYLYVDLKNTFSSVLYRCIGSTF